MLILLGLNSIICGCVPETTTEAGEGASEDIWTLRFLGEGGESGQGRLLFHMEHNQEFALAIILIPAVQFPMQRHAALWGNRRDRIKKGKARGREREIEKVLGILQNSMKRQKVMEALKLHAQVPQKQDLLTRKSRSGLPTQSRY